MSKRIAKAAVLVVLGLTILAFVPVAYAQEEGDTAGQSTSVTGTQEEGEAADQPASESDAPEEGDTVGQAASVTDRGIGWIGGALGAGLAMLGGGLGVARIGSAATESIARQPEAYNQIFLPMIITAAMVEGAALFAIVVGLLAVIK